MFPEASRSNKIILHIGCYAPGRELREIDDSESAWQVHLQNCFVRLLISRPNSCEDTIFERKGCDTTRCSSFTTCLGSLTVLVTDLGK
jgi:hypothetical protein